MVSRAHELQGLSRLGRSVEWMLDSVDGIRSRPWVQKHVNFYRLHVAYFIVVSGLGTILLWLTTSERISFVDALYTVISCTCTTGLQSVRETDIRVSHTVLLMILMILGSPLLTSLLPLFVRRFYFLVYIRKQFNETSGNAYCLRDAVKENDSSSCASTKVTAPLTSTTILSERETNSGGKTRGIGICRAFKDFIKTCRGKPEEETKQAGIDGEGMPKDSLNYLHACLSPEYQALSALSSLTICFFVGAPIVGYIIGTAFKCLLDDPNAVDATLKLKHIEGDYFILYSTISSFTNAGYSIWNDSYIDFSHTGRAFKLSWMLMALLGNALYPPILWLMVWMTSLLSNNEQKPAFEYLLNYPRRCFTHLFSKHHTIWLVLITIALTFIQVIFLLAFEWHGTLIHLNTFDKFFNSIFQAVGSRNAGGDVLDLSQLSAPVVVLIACMMYISPYPLYVSRQSTVSNYDGSLIEVYKENQAQPGLKNNLKEQCRALLAQDAAILCISLLAICVFERRSMKTDPLNYSPFKICFELISAFGNIGLSLGYSCSLRMNKDNPCEQPPYSFSGRWNTTSKLIIVLMMFLGRHRGLPTNIDPAIQLPGTPCPKSDAALSRTTSNFPKRSVRILTRTFTTLGLVNPNKF